MIDMADIVLFNWRGEREYRHTVSRLLRELGIKP
jgi:hypothetical protein